MRTTPFFSFISLWLSLSLLIISCQKEYSFEGGLQAQYTVIGSPGTCQPVVVSGFYIEGKATDSSNTLQVNVNVTRPGNYTIFTLPVNGLSFTASGAFADTGLQVVTLQCSGIPQAPGTFSVKIPGDNGCSFTLMILKKAPASYTLGGTVENCSAHTANTFTEGKTLVPGDFITLQVTVKVPGNYMITTDTVNGISFSSSGNFSMTGPQSVNLLGNGTPSATGYYFFTVHADSSQCDFSISVIDGEPVATYVLQSGMQNAELICSPSSVQGTYTAGTPLNSSNSIIVSPYATVAGNYTISTYKINGMIFFAHGAFTAAGNYNIALQGSGTPLAAGTFTFTPLIIGAAPLGGASCDITIDVK